MTLETRFVQAMFDFNPQEEGELAFKRGDIITCKVETGVPTSDFSDQPGGPKLVGR